MVPSFYQCFLILKPIVSFQIVQGTSIEGPPNINRHIGEDALFLWNTTDQGKIFAVKWGIRKGSIAEPWYINLNVLSNRVNKNTDIEETLRNRIEFIGDLNRGRAWFVLKNLSFSDANEYIASISKDGTSFRPYYVTLKVLEKKRETPTSDYNKTTVSVNITAAPSSKCGTVCIAAIVCGIFIISAPIIGVFFCRKKWKRP